MNPENTNYAPQNTQGVGYGKPTTIDGVYQSGVSTGSYQNYQQAPPQPPQQPSPYPTPSLTPQASPNLTPKKSGGHLENIRSVLSTLLMLAVAPLIALGITAFALQSYQVDGQSMETTLQDHDRLIVNKTPRTIARITKHQYLPHRGDIIIFNQANLPDTSFGTTKQLIKRVIGLPGDQVVITNGKITVYNKQNPQGFNPDESVGYHITATDTEGEIDVTLKEGQVFVCGDNRGNSEDSRYFGAIDANNIVGKLVLRLLPLNKAQRY